MAEESERSLGYSRTTGLIYIFNLIVGTGALTLPAAFHDAGWALSSVILILLAFMSFLTATFVIESMAAANALLHWKRLQQLKRSGDRSSSSTSSGIRVRILNCWYSNYWMPNIFCPIFILSTVKKGNNIVDTKYSDYFTV